MIYWQPISGQVKDGRDYLLLEDGHAHVGAWHEWDFTHIPHKVNPAQKGAEWLLSYDGVSILHPTHWAPIPEIFRTS